MGMLTGGKDDKRTGFIMRLTASERETIERNARKYAGGNISAWLRYTGIQHKPKPEELVHDDDDGRVRVRAPA